MKISRAVPTAGLLAVSLVLGACGSDSNDNNTASTTNAGTTGTTTGTTSTTGTTGTATTATGAVNSVAAIKAARTGAHESTSAELTAGYYATAAAAQNATAPATATALGAYGQVFTAADNTATNTRVQLRNLETYVRSGGKWSRVQYSNQVRGAFYNAAYNGDAQACELGTCLRAESSGGVSVKMTAGKLFRFWPEAAFTQSLVKPAQVEAIFTKIGRAHV